MSSLGGNVKPRQICVSLVWFLGFLVSDMGRRNDSRGSHRAGERGWVSSSGRGIGRSRDNSAMTGPEREGLWHRHSGDVWKGLL